MEIGIVGLGYVGGTLHRGYLKHNINVHTFDINKSMNPTCQSIEELVRRSELIYVAVPTPQSSNGECDTSIVFSVVQSINNAQHHSKIPTTIVIKSTMPPGTTKKLQSLYPKMAILFSPEFLREQFADDDFAEQPMMLMGYADVQYYATAKKALGIQAEAISFVLHAAVVSADVAELYKYVANTFLATKVSFANEMSTIADAHNISWDKVAYLLAQDKRLGATHWDVPGPDGKYGFGGNCFPKDLNALINYADSVPTPILDAVLYRNIDMDRDKKIEK